MRFSNWVRDIINNNIVPKLEFKNGTYGSDLDEFYAFEATAKRHFPEKYNKNKWYAMADVAAVLEDKHLVTLAKNPGCNENFDRITDCIIYDLFRAYFIEEGNKLRKYEEELDTAL